jgi:hypothetical protein
MSFPSLSSLPKIDTSQIDFARVKTGAAGASHWISRTIESLCNRPDHLQRLAIIAAGCVMYPTVWGLILIVWKGFGDHPTLYPQQLQILGWALLGSMVLWGLVVIALLGIVKGIKVEGPGGIGVELMTTSSGGGGDHDHDGFVGDLQQTTVTATATQDGAPVATTSTTTVAPAAPAPTPAPAPAAAEPADDAAPAPEAKPPLQVSD